MNYREQFTKETEFPAMIDGILITSYSEWLESFLKDKDELIQAEEELITFYDEMIAKHAVFLNVHQQGYTHEEITKGFELREKIKTLKSKTI